MTERDERALRQALEDLGEDEPVDLGRVRRRVAERRRNSRTVAGLAVALVLVAGVVGLPRLMGAGSQSATSAAGGETGSEAAGEAEPGSGPAQDAGPGQPEAEPEAQPSGRQAATPPPADAARVGWRTEYYRDISFAVPSSWGYAVPPQSDWCADDPAGKPRADQRRPYVWLGTDLVIRTIGCGEARPASLLTEHVEALSPGPAVDYIEGAVRQGEWWVVTRFTGSAVLVVTTKDRARADQILDSARVDPKDALCAPSSPIAGPLGARPDDGTDLSRLKGAADVVLCQYEPAPDPADVKLPSLRAAVRLSPAAASTLLTELATAPANDQTCDPASVDERPDLAVLVRIQVDGALREVYVNPAGCPGGAGMSGGIDDGTTIRVLTRPACSALLTPPLAIWSASGDVARSCLG